MSGNTTYDFLIVGAGLFGAVFARQLTDAGYRCLVIDKRSHIAGNVFSYDENGIEVHKYGAHIFHTNDEGIWKYVNRFAKFNSYTHRVEVNHDGKLFSFPINLKTFEQIWGITNEQDAKLKLLEVGKVSKGEDLESWAISKIGEELYQRFIKGYTTKQWGREPSGLPSAILKRIPIRTYADDRYFSDTYQGIPENGYTAMVQNILRGIDVQLDSDFLDKRNFWETQANQIVFTGPIDAFFDYTYGALEYRSLRFDHKVLEQDQFQSKAVINYSNADVPYTRIIEHKHFNPVSTPHTVVTREYPEKWSKDKEAYYPIRDEKNIERFKAYKALAQNQHKYIFGGRLAEYRYYDMHQVIASALTKSQQTINSLTASPNEISG